MADQAPASTDDPLFRPTRLRRKFASIEAAAIAGIVCAIAWSVALRGLLRTPSLKATDEAIADFYDDTPLNIHAVALLQVLVIGTIAFLWFVGVVRARLGDVEPRLFGTVFFGASLLLAAMLFTGAALLAAPAVLVEVGGKVPDPAMAGLTRSAAAIVLSIFAPRVATLVMFSTAALGRATGALPKWLVWLSYLVGTVEFINVTVAEPTVFLVPAWIAVVSAVLLIRRPPRGFTLAAPDQPS